MEYKYKATVIRVVDGDTVDFLLDLGLNVHVKARVRLLNVDTPETYGVKKDSSEYQRGLMAKQVTSDWLARHEYVIVQTQKDKTGKYGRWLATIFSPDQKDNLNDLLVSKGWSDWS